MPKNTPNSTQLVSYHQLPSGEHRGVITQDVSKPYHIIIDKKGRWQIQDYGAGDEPQTIASGKAHNVHRAKQQVTAQAYVHIDELKITNQASTKSEQHRPFIRVVKIYVGLSLLAFAALMFARLLLIHRPFVFIRGAFWVGASVFIAHRLIVFATNAAKRLDYLAGARTSPPTEPSKQHQPMKMPRLQQSKRKPKALPSGKGVR